MSYLVGIRESVERILTTPVGSRVMEPTFGSRIHELIDRRPDREWSLTFIRYCHDALKRWEPRVKLVRAVPYATDGHIKVSLYLMIVERNEKMEIEVTFE